VRFIGNRGIGPVSWFEPKRSIFSDMISMFAGNPPLMELLEMSRYVTFENAVENQ
jgi:hypothetical protein